jgi:hypothetical protein
MEHITPDETQVKIEPRIDPDFQRFFDDFISRKAWMPFVEREVIKLLALKEGK